MRNAIMILCGFAAIWGIFALGYAAAPKVALVLPVAISLAIGWMVTRRIAATGASRANPGHAGRVVMWASIGQGVAIIVAAIILQNLDRGDLIVTAMAAIVGAHFLPLARYIPAPGYYATGAAMIAVAAVGLAFAPPLRGLVTCGGSALVLWATTLSFLRARSGLRA